MARIRKRIRKKSKYQKRSLRQRRRRPVIPPKWNTCLNKARA